MRFAIAIVKLPEGICQKQLDLIGNDDWRMGRQRQLFDNSRTLSLLLIIRKHIPKYLIPNFQLFDKLFPTIEKHIPNYLIPNFQLFDKLFPTIEKNYSQLFDSQLSTIW